MVTVSGRSTQLSASSPLGRPTGHPDRYAPEVLHAIARSEQRQPLGIDDAVLPFGGEDLWTAYDLAWLTASGRPAAAIGTLRVPAASPALIESKSLKLYLGSLAMTPFDDERSVVSTIERDLSRVCGAAVEVALRPPSARGALSDFPGIGIDDLDVTCDCWEVDASLLDADPDEIAAETLHSHLLRSLCPVTGQPDVGSVLIRYRGPRLDRRALLRYLVSYRSSRDFHETCVERIFLDLKRRCACRELSVYARYNRRGGIDINPFRSDTDDRAPDIRLPRQ